MPAQYGYANPHWYDLLWDRTSGDQPDIGFLFARTHGGAALELGAGTGRVALRLAAQGITMICVEPSSAMRAVFISKLAQQPTLFPRITLLPDAATTFRLAEPVSLIYAVGVAHHWLSEREVKAVLANVYAHLAPGGRFVCDSIATQVVERTAPLEQVASVQIGAHEYRTSMAEETLAPQFHKFTGLGRKAQEL